MRIHLTRKKGLLRFAGVAAAVAALATMGLIPAASAHTVARAGPAAAGSASAVAAPASVCRWFPVPAAAFLGDPTAFYPSIDGQYNLPGNAGVAYKLTGEFPHSTTMSFTTYNDIYELESPNYVIMDSSIIPDPGSVNPFVPGTRVEGTPRNYTVYVWPDSVPVPAGLQNVILYPTKAVNPRDKTAVWLLTMRLYKMQPGYRAIAAAPTVHAVSAYDPSKYVRCPTSPVGYFRTQIKVTLAKIRVTGPIVVAPEPKTGDKIYFTAYPADSAAGTDGYPANGCITYLAGNLPTDEISVVTVHKVPQYFNNNLVTPASVMKDYQTRYLSQTILYYPSAPAISVNTDNAVYTSDGRWVTVYLPGEPRLSASEIAQVRAVAAAHDYNVIQVPPKPSRLRPLARLLPYPSVLYRNKAVSATFPYSVTAVPCWATHHDYRTYSKQTSRAFFARYASNPRNMGPYWIGGVKMSFAQFMKQY